MKIEKEQIRHVASLAKLKISEAEEERLSEEMGSIIGFADRLRELDEREYASSETENGALFNVFREDTAGEPFGRERLLECAPEQYGGCYVVPKTVE